MATIQRGTVIEGAVTPRREVNVSFTAAEVRGLTTPATVIPNPGPGKAILLDDVFAFKSGAAFAGVGAGDDLEFRYTDDSGTEIMDIETDGFLDGAGNQRRHAGRSEVDYATTGNAPVVAHLGGP